jgi:hypothetical protein
VDAEGDVFLHGARNFSVGIEVAYDPPILWLDAPLALGNTWSTIVTIYFSLDGQGEGQGPIEIRHGVFFEGEMIVPAGQFLAYGVGGVTPEFTVGGEVFDLEGARRGGLEKQGAANGGEIGEWFSDGVGVIRDHPQLDLLLTSWTEPPPTSTTESSWGALKGLFATE